MNFIRKRAVFATLGLIFGSVCSDISAMKRPRNYFADEPIAKKFEIDQEFNQIERLRCERKRCFEDFQQKQWEENLTDQVREMSIKIGQLRIKKRACDPKPLDGNGGREKKKIKFDNDLLDEQLMGITVHHVLDTIEWQLSCRRLREEKKFEIERLRAERERAFDILRDNRDQKMDSNQGMMHVEESMKVESEMDIEIEGFDNPLAGQIEMLRQERERRFNTCGQEAMQGIEEIVTYVEVLCPDKRRLKEIKEF